MVDSGQLVGLIALSLPFFALVAVVGGHVILRWRTQRRLKRLIQSLADKHNSISVLNAEKNSLAKKLKSTTSNQLDSTKRGTNSLKDSSVRRRTYKSYANPATRKKQQKKENQNDL